jgi:hypothetical protein
LQSSTSFSLKEIILKSRKCKKKWQNQYGSAEQ